MNGQEECVVATTGSFWESLNLVRLELDMRGSTLFLST